MDATSDTLDIGQRWATALMHRYPGRLPGSLDAKRVARDFDISVRTAEGWGDGQTPYAKHIFLACRLHGPAILLEVFAPGTDAARLAHLGESIAELEAKFRSMGDELARLRVVRGP